MCTINLGQIALETFLPLPPSGLVPSLPLFLPCLLGCGGVQLSAWSPEHSLLHLTLTVLRDVCFREHMNPCPVTAPAVPPLHTLVIILPAFILKRNAASCFL